MLTDIIAGRVDGDKVKSELLSLSTAWRKLGITPLSKESSPILFIPGNDSNDKSTMHIRRVLDALGYKTFPSGIDGDQKVDMSGDCLGHLERNIRDTIEKVGGPVVLVGHSAGSLIACQMAKKLPSGIAGVIGVGGLFNFEEDVLKTVAPADMDVEDFRARLMKTPFYDMIVDLAAGMPQCPVVSIASDHDEVFTDPALAVPSIPNAEVIFIRQTNRDVILEIPRSGDNPAGPGHGALIFNARVAEGIHRTVQAFVHASDERPTDLTLDLVA